MSGPAIDLLSYLRQSDGLNEPTLNSLIIYGFDSSASLMAMDLNKDLPQLSAISLGQRALLKQIMTDYMTNRPSNRNLMNDSSDEDMNRDENCCHNKMIIEKIKEVLKFSGNETFSKMKDSLKKYKQSLIRSRHEVTKLKAENQSKDIELKKLSSEIFRLRNRNNDNRSYENVNKELNNEIRDKDISIKKLELKVSELLKQKTGIIDEFNGLQQKCLDDLIKLKTYMIRESMVIHRVEQLSDGQVLSEPQPISQPPELQPVLTDNTSDKQTNTEPTHCYTSVRPPELMPEVLDEDIRKQVSKENDLNNNKTFNFISLDESVVSANEIQDKSISSLNTSSQVVRVSNDMTFQYLSPVSSNHTDNGYTDHNYSVITELSIESKNQEISQISSNSVHNSSDSNSMTTRKQLNKRQTNSNKTNKDSKKQKISQISAGELTEEGDSSSHLVLLCNPAELVNDGQENQQRLRSNSVTFSTIKSSKLISIDISGETESDGNTTDTNSLILKQNIISGINVSQISTSNGYMSDSNEENRCSIVNAVAHMATGMISTESSDASPVQPNRTGFKCIIEGCDFVTLFQTKFDDHVRNHVTYHYGQEIPDFWRPYFEDYKKDLPKFKSN